MKLVKLFSALLAVLTALVAFSVVSFAHDTSEEDELLSQVYSEYYTDFTGETTNEECRYVLEKKLTIRKDTVINEDSKLYLKKGASLIIKNNAKLIVNGQLTIEQGAKLYITNGSVKIKGYCDNYGKIIIRKTGKLSVKGMYLSNGFSRINLEGKAYFGNVSLKKLIKQIRKTDPNFKLSNCVIDYIGETYLFVYYRVGNAVTDYCYTLSALEEIESIEVSNFNPEKVYDKDLNKKINTAVQKYISKKKINETLLGQKYLEDVNLYFSYSYKTNTLNYEGTCFELVYDDYLDFMIYDHVYQDTLKI